MCRDKLATLRRIEAYTASDDSPDGCWPWTAFCNRDGYGTIKVWDESRGRFGGRLATRVLWEIVNGPIPDGIEICHSCDNPPCMRPNHLSLGTHVDNVADAVSRNRTRKGMRQDPATVQHGEAHGMARLLPEQVLAIRARYAAGETQRALAAEFGVTFQNIHRITSRKSWTHI